MEEVIHYLELKNQYYEKFFSITHRFLDDARANRWDDLELLVDNRERILNIIRSYDLKIANLFEQLDLTKSSLDVYRDRVKRLLDDRGIWGKKIVSIDLDLISLLEEMKSDTIRDLKRTLETKSQVEAFNPPSVATPRTKTRTQA